MLRFITNNPKTSLAVGCREATHSKLLKEKLQIKETWGIEPEQNNKMKIAATVVFYNPEDDIFDNISSYITDVEKLIIIDNSTKYNLGLINKLKNTFSNIEYINNNGNLGIATALNIGCMKAIEYNFEWILTMDQDSKFINFEHYKKCLFSLNNQDNIALIAANTMWHAKEHLPSHPTCNYEEKFLVITSANFLNLNLFESIGRFEDKLFIDMVDHDYCIRAQEKKYKIYYFKDVLVEHSLGNLFKRKNLITRKVKNKIEHNPQRVYYITRNFLYTWKQYSDIFPKEFNLIKTINILFIHQITKIILYEDQKLKKIYAKFLGLTHFLMSKYGKYDI
jgi:rhamnosyltransferase